MAGEYAIIKGVRDGMLILLDDSAPWDEVLAELRARLEERSSFFRSASVTINLGERIIDEPEWGSLRALLAPHEIELNVVVSSSTQSRAVAAAHGVRNRAPAFAPRAESLAESTAAADWEHAPDAAGKSGRIAQQLERRREHAPGGAAGQPRAAVAEAMPAEDGEPDFLAIAGDPEADEADASVQYGWEAAPAGALFLRRTLRSGMSVRHDGDVCILGDVNAGAEIVAGGDVLVWGSLRGLVHAGAGGDNAAVVGALLLAPTQLRIADVLSRAPADAPPLNGRPLPELARVEGERIVVEDWSPRRRQI